MTTTVNTLAAADAAVRYANHLPDDEWIDERPTFDTDPVNCRWCLDEFISRECPYHGETAQAER